MKKATLASRGQEADFRRGGGQITAPICQSGTQQPRQRKWKRNEQGEAKYNTGEVESRGVSSLGVRAGWRLLAARRGHRGLDGGAGPATHWRVPEVAGGWNAPRARPPVATKVTIQWELCVRWPRGVTFISEKFASFLRDFVHISFEHISAFAPIFSSKNTQAKLKKKTTCI